MTEPKSYRRVYKTIGDQEIDVEVYLPENAKQCPVGKTAAAYTIHG